MSEKIQLNIEDNGVANLILNNPEKRNAFDSEMIQTLIEHLKKLSSNTDIRLLLLSANGDHFSAGADLQRMQESIHFSKKDNIDDAMKLAKLMQRLDSFPAPTIVKVQGAAYGGALGLIACCDIALGTSDAKFCFSETKLGLIPAIISPYVIRAIGERHARRYFLTAEIIPADTAFHIGLIHAYDENNMLEKLLKSILDNGPNALKACKQLIKTVATLPLDDELIAYTAKQIADIRAGKEAQTRLKDFLDDK